MEEVAEISNMVQQNANIVKLAVNQLDQISDVVEENVRISYNTKEVSSNMAEITDNLLELMEAGDEEIKRNKDTDEQEQQ